MVAGKALSEQKCVPCSKGSKPLDADQTKAYLRQLPLWSLAPHGKSIYRDYVMKDFLAACRLIQDIAKIAEKEDHHPDLHLTGYRKLKIELSTHSIGGLSENDFILASKIEGLPKDLKT